MRIAAFGFLLAAVPVSAMSEMVPSGDRGPLHGGRSARSTPSSTTTTTARAAGAAGGSVAGSVIAGSPKRIRALRGAVANGALALLIETRGSAAGGEFIVVRGVHRVSCIGRTFGFAALLAPSMALALRASFAVRAPIPSRAVAAPTRSSGDVGDVVVGAVDVEHLVPRSLGLPHERMSECASCACDR